MVKIFPLLKSQNFHVFLLKKLNIFEAKLLNFASKIIIIIIITMVGSYRIEAFLFSYKIKKSVNM